jgi:hypothetical protein
MAWESEFLGNRLKPWVQPKIPLERYGWFQVISFPKCYSDLFEGKSYDLVVQV